MKQFTFIATFIFTLASSLANAANWIMLNSTSTEFHEIVSVDFDSITGYYFNPQDKSKTFVTAWVKLEFPNGRRLSNGRAYSEQKILWYIDCKNQKISLSEGYAFNSQGSLVGSVSNPLPTHSSSSWENAIPDTLASGLLKEICYYYQLKYTSRT